MNKIHESRVKIEAPFRLAVMGPSSSGKSHFIYNFIAHAHKLTNLHEKYDKVVIIFCYNQNASVLNMEKMCREQGMDFHAEKLLPNIQRLEAVQRTALTSYKQAMVLVLEDLEFTLAGLSNKEKLEFVSFMTRSRHEEISFILANHNIPLSQHRNVVMSTLMSNLTVLVLMRYTDLRRPRLLFQSLFPDQNGAKLFTDLFSQAETIAERNGTRPYVAIFLDPKLPLNSVGRVRLDLFGKHVLADFSILSV